ncbi:MAG: HEAT repeat domain-containing protein, partial [Candidatus Hydrogenedentota bacterium]
FIMSFIRAKRDVFLYPAENPVVTESIDQALQLLKKSFSTDSSVELLVEKDRLQVNGSVVGAKEKRVSRLSVSLYNRGICRITLEPSIPFEEMRILLETINSKPEEIAEAGGIASLIKSKGITCAAVEGPENLTIADGEGLPVSDDVSPELENLEDVEVAVEELDSPESFSRMFASIEQGDLISLERLRALLRNPEEFSKLLEKSALQLENVKREVDAVGRAERMLKILDTVGAAITSLPSESERAHMLENLAVSVLGLSADLEDDLINEGLLPNLGLKSIESSILSRFPIPELAEALLEDFELSGGAASSMQSYFDNLELSGIERSALAETLRNKLNETGMLTPDVDAVLTTDKAEPDAATADDEKTVPLEDTIPRIEGYPPEKILFREDERSGLTAQISTELDAPAPDVMVSALLELMRHEETPVNHAVLVARAMSYMEHFLAKNNYERAAFLIKGLKAELEQKKRIFSRIQLNSLQNAIEEHFSQKRMQQLIDTLTDLKKEGSTFEGLVNYFDAIGPSAVAALVHSLEHEKSRHVRLLACEALARIGSKSMTAVAKKIDHPKWYVVRNVVSILSQIGIPECIPYLRKGLAHEDIRVKREAMKGLASIRTEEAVDLLCACADGGDVNVCKTALEWLAAIEAEQALPTLERLLSDGNIWKKDNDVLGLAIEALGSIGSESAKLLLENLSQVRSFFRRRKAALVREAAALALHNGKGE